MKTIPVFASSRDYRVSRSFNSVVYNIREPGGNCTSIVIHDCTVRCKCISYFAGYRTDNSMYDIYQVVI